MVTRWSDSAEGGVGLATLEGVDRAEPRPGREQRGVEGGPVDCCVGVDPSAPLLAEPSDGCHQVAIVHAAQLVDSGRTREVVAHSVHDLRCLHSLEHRAESIGSLGVAAPEIVVEVAVVGEEQEGHALGTLQAATTVGAMPGHRLLTRHDARLRIAPWRGDASTAYLTPARGRPTAEAVSRALNELAAAPYATALTPALPLSDQQPFLDAGFELHERLHLLVRDLESIPDTDARSVRLRRGRHADRPRILTVDHDAFPPFWRIDGPGLTDAIAATPSARLRVALGHGAEAGVVGYAVTGRAGARGYLQRLAVEPHQQGAGAGTALVTDALRWLRRWGAKQVVVNTQEANDRALRLYERLGFQLQVDGLAVLRRTLGHPPR